MNSPETSVEKVTVAYFFSIGRKSIAFAFWSMAIDRLQSRKFTGISFSKLLGTGTGQTFTPSDANLTRWSMVLVIDKSQVEAFDRSPIISRWRTRSTHEFRAVLKPLSSHGLWAKQNPFDFISEQNDPNSKIAAITRARIKWNKNLIFWKSTPPVVLDLHQSPGLITAIGIGEAPIGLQGTFSLWESAAALRDFAYKGDAHKVAIKQTQQIGWYSEELFSRFEVLELRGEISANTRS
jgi:heme-degrading monooxygenase HmoA